MVVKNVLLSRKRQNKTIDQKRIFYQVALVVLSLTCSAACCMAFCYNISANVLTTFTACPAGQCSVNDDIVFLWERMNFDQL
jgi:hypothetical protein